MLRRNITLVIGVALSVMSMNTLLATDITWTGNTSKDWNTASNWSPASIPTALDNVNIPEGLTQYPEITTLEGVCLDLAIGNTSSLKVSVNLTINGSLTISGSLITEGFIFIRIYGDISWLASSFSTLSDQTNIEVYGDWYNLPGSSNSMNHGYVYFKGDTDSYIYSDESSSSFNNLTNNKVAPASLNISGNSAEDLIIEGYLLNQAGTILNVFSTHFLIINGIINCDNGFLHCYDGVVLLRDPSENFMPAQGTFFNDLIVEFENGTWNILNNFCDTLIINSSLSITSGFVRLNYLDMSVGLNLFDTHHGLITVSADIIFNGAYPEQMVKGIQVQKIVVNKPGNGLVIFAEDTSQVGSYDWISGGIAVQNAVLDIDQLDDNGLAGTYHLNGGQLIIHNATSVDLLGELKISSGKMQLYSENDTAYWPAANNCKFEMFGGELEILNSLNLSYVAGQVFTCNIFGGEIRIAGHLIGNNPQFHPNHGTIILHISGNSRICSVDGFAFYNLTIGKCPTDTVIALNDLVIGGNFTLASGLFSAPDSMTVFGDWTNNSGPGSFRHNLGKVVFTGGNNSHLYTNETFYDLIIKKSLPDTALIYLTNNNTLHTTRNLSVLEGSLNMRLDANLNVDGNVFIAPFAGIISSFISTGTIFIKGNWTNANPLIYNNYRGFKACNLIVFNGESDQIVTAARGTETFNNCLISKASGEFLVNDNLEFYKNLNLLSGTWHNNQPGLTHYLHGDFTKGVNSFWNSSDNPAMLEFVGIYPQNITYNGGGELSGIRINKFFPEIYQEDANQVVSLQSGLTCSLGMLMINQGTFDLNGNTASFGSGALLTTTSATLEVDTGAILKLGTGGLMVNNGTVIFKGELNNKSKITHIGTGYYPFYIDHGHISAHHAIFEYMDTSGVSLGSGVTVNPLASFNHCTFQYGQAGGTLLNLKNQDMISHHIHFPTNTWGSAYNVTKTNSNGTVNFVADAGDFSGEVFENDPYNTINWLGPMAVFAAADPAIIISGDSSQLNAIIAGGTAPYTVVWSPNTGLSNAAITNPKASPLATTTYTVSVTDNDGITDTDTVTVFVISPPGAALSGTLQYFSLTPQPLDSVVVVLKRNNEVVDTAWTNLQGFYSFPFVVSGNYTIVCLSTIPWGGVNSSDALLILKHYVGMITLSGMLFEAADINNSNTLNTIDALLVARRFAGYINSFPVGNWTYNYPETVIVGTDDIDLDFRGICYGDVNMSYTIVAK